MDNEKKKIFILVLLGLLVVAFFFSRSCKRTDVSNNGDGADAVRAELGDAIQAERDQGARISELDKQISEAQRESENIRVELTDLAGEEQGDRELIRDCQRILQEVRSRAEKDTAAP